MKVNEERLKAQIDEIVNYGAAHCEECDLTVNKVMQVIEPLVLAVEAISLQPEWVAIEPLLTVIENGLTEHINLLNKINEKLKGDNDFWDYQTAAETNEALVELRRLLTPQPPTK